MSHDLGHRDARIHYTVKYVQIGTTDTNVRYLELYFTWTGLYRLARANCDLAVTFVQRCVHGRSSVRTSLNVRSKCCQGRRLVPFADGLENALVLIVAVHKIVKAIVLHNHAQDDGLPQGKEAFIIVALDDGLVEA
jgi:hypothetical protein